MQFLLHQHSCNFSLAYYNGTLNSLTSSQTQKLILHILSPKVPLVTDTSVTHEAILKETILCIIKLNFISTTCYLNVHIRLLMDVSDDNW